MMYNGNKKVKVKNYNFSRKNIQNQNKHIKKQNQFCRYTIDKGKGINKLSFQIKILSYTFIIGCILLLIVIGGVLA